MVIKSLELADFRNYKELNINFDTGTNILYGDNAQGKTNILEAIYISATTKSHKGSKDREIVNFVQVGIPIAFQEILTQFSFLALCAFINRLGLAASSGYGVANKIVSFVMLVPSSLMQSMSSFVAQNVGAGKEGRARKAMVYVFPHPVAPK